MRRHSHRDSREAGFTLVELLLTVVLVAMIILVTLFIFDTMSKTSRAQVNLVDLQQNQRVAQRELARFVRSAGRGGLTVESLSRGGADPNVSRLMAVEVRNNVGLGGNGGEVIVTGEAAEAVPGSDVLITRGVFNSAVYHLDYTDPGVFQEGVPQVIVNDPSPTGVPQNLDPLKELIDEEMPEALVFTDALGDAFGVAELNPGSSSYTEDSVTLSFLTTGGQHADEYAELSRGGAFPAFRKVLTVGMLEEYRHYVSEEDGVRRLARARVYPNTEVLHGAGDELDLVIAGDIGDLQVALAYDSHLRAGYLACDVDTEGADDRIVASADGADDDWLFNLSTADEGGEDLSQPPWERPAGGSWDDPEDCTSVVEPELFYVRFTTVARAPRPDPFYEAETLERIEDRAYGTASDDYFNGNFGRLHRWRTLQTTIDPRNV